MRVAGAAVIVFSLLVGIATGCRSSDEEQAAKLCDEARALEDKDLERSLELRRKVWEEMPTAGTPSARACGREMRVRMGKVRVLVATDETGSPEAIEGCAWTAGVLEVFDRALIPPYRANWARRLAERCVDVVGRAWTRKPDDPQLADLNTRLKKLSTEPK